jgi:hypothetical protein
MAVLDAAGNASTASFTTYAPGPYVTGPARETTGKYLRLQRTHDFRTDLTPSVLNRSGTFAVATAPGRVAEGGKMRLVKQLLGDKRLSAPLSYSS